MSDYRNLRLIAVTALVLGFALNVHAAPISKCDAAKKKCLGKYVAAALVCHAKAEQTGAAVESACLSKAGAKVAGGGKGCFDKAEAPPNDCSTPGDLSARLGEADAAIRDLVGRIDPSYPTPTLTRCGAARKKCAGKKMAGLMACAAKENKDGLGDPSCAPKTRDKFGGAKGCDVKALTKGPDCLGSTSTAVLESTIDAWQSLIADGIDGTLHVACGDGIHEPGEVCDDTAPFDVETTCPGATACDAACACVSASTLHVAVDPTSPDSVLDTGWTGLGHRMPLVSGTELTLTVSNCDGGPLAGTCELHGPIANSGAGELRNQRCSNDSSIRCTDDAPCLPGGGTCELYVGAPFPLSVGGIGLCNQSRFFGPIVGTLNLGAGDIALSAARQVGVFKKNGPDNPCARCIGDPLMNDDTQGGTCDSGSNSGHPCDANGIVPGRPDFGETSLDCPMDPTGLLKSLVIDASSASSTVTLTLSTSSPLCGDGSGTRCLCASCNNVGATACASNADCPHPSGPFPGICGGRRCMGGTNDGTGCSTSSECPGVGAACGQPGEPSKASACLDDSTTPIPFQCVDTAPVDGEGECLAGPVTKMCSAPHSQRPCGADPDCAPGTCIAHQRPCFLTGGLTQDPGTNTLSAEGAPDPFVANVASPTLASVFCVPPTNRSFGDTPTGHPGPARMTAKTTMTLRP